MSDFLNGNRLPADVSRLFFPYLQQWLALFPGEIRAASIYGSATGPDYLSGKSDINSVFVMRSVGFAHLHRALKIVSEGRKQKITAPLVLTAEGIDSSVDVFPIEFLDIKENHILVYGEDLLSRIDVPLENLRLFCEHQVKGKLLRIRQAYLEHGLEARAIDSLLKESVHALIPIFRNLIRLKGRTPVIDKTAVLRDVCELSGLEPAIFLSIYEHRIQARAMSLAGAQEFMERYLQQLEKLAAAVDQW